MCLVLRIRRPASLCTQGYMSRCALMRVRGLLWAADCYFIEKVRAALLWFACLALLLGT